MRTVYAVLAATLMTLALTRVMTSLQVVVIAALAGRVLAGPLIASSGDPATATLPCSIGLAFVLLIVVRGRAYLWKPGALANAQ